MSHGLVYENLARRLIGRNVPLLAPSCKGGGTDPDPGDAETGLLKLPLDSLGTLKPGIVGRRQLVGVAEQLQQSRIVAAGIPGQRERLKWCRQGFSSQDGFHQGWVNGRKLSRVKNGAMDQG